MKLNHNKLITVSTVDVFELLVIKNDYPYLMPNRLVKEYWTLEGKFIGSIDPLTQFSAIIDAIKNDYQVKK